MRFARVNVKGSEGYQAKYQRHHLIPVAVKNLSELWFARTLLLEAGFCFDDFTTNGLLLPSCEKEAVKAGLPLHRGPHPLYNEFVIEHIVIIAKMAERCNEISLIRSQLINQIRSLQKTLATSLLNHPAGNLYLHKRDPVRSRMDFSFVDSHIDKLHAARKLRPSFRP